MPGSALLVGVGDLENARFVECPAENLQSDRQFASLGRPGEIRTGC